MKLKNEWWGYSGQYGWAVMIEIINEHRDGGQLHGAGPVSARKMFGEYCLYYDGTPVGLVCDNRLYVKPTEAGRALLRVPQEGSPYTVLNASAKSTLK